MFFLSLEGNQNRSLDQGTVLCSALKHYFKYYIYHLRAIHKTKYQGAQTVIFICYDLAMLMILVPSILGDPEEKPRLVSFQSCLYPNLQI